MSDLIQEQTSAPLQSRDMASPPSRRVLLLAPPSGLYRRDDRCQSRVEDQAVHVVLPPVDLAVLAAIARDAGAEPCVRDYPALGSSWDHLRADLEEFRPDTVVLGITNATVEADLGAARLAKELDPETCVVARGEILDREGERILSEHPEVDLALCGEAEEVFGQFVRGFSLSELKGALWRDAEGEVRRNAGRALVADFDALPLPARDLLDNGLYLSPETRRPITVIKAGRGCFARCIYCPAGSMSDHKLRLRSPESVLAEVRECVERFEIRDFLFDGDTFTAKKSWLLEVCALLEQADLGIRWGCNSRVDTMDADRARALSRAGCVLVAFGVESGDQRMLDEMKKGARVEQAESAVAACKAVGLGTHAFFIIGLPGETQESLGRTMDLLRRLDTDLFDINIATPLPGTEFYEIALAEGLLRPGEEGGNYSQATVRSRELSAEFLTRWRRRALLRLYARPRYVGRTLLRAARQGLLMNYVRAAATRLRTLLR